MSMAHRDIAWNETMANIKREIAFCHALRNEGRCNMQWLTRLEQMRAELRGRADVEDLQAAI